ncbi:hypothetical protein GBAR_LOCUS19878 [Geodia barretti]|uniref:Uncharacterized protein n=1 Tax=Geodia barretti TaxID=519541 RepID=A0AA35WWH9_GEOBA|nr:hypothetical protein GBAR_LOCUS19878 [Geodia barretti]
MPNHCTSGDRGARSGFVAYPASQELIVSGSHEDTKCNVGTVTVASEKEEKVTIVSGTYLFDFPYEPSLEDPVSTQGPDDDYHSESISSGRQTSDASSSGVVADASSQSSEVVPGVEMAPATDRVNNEGIRGGRNVMPDDCSSSEQGARSVFLAYRALHEEGLTVSESGGGDNGTKCDVETNSTIESGEGGKATIVSGTYVFDFPYKPSLEEVHMLPPLEGNDDRDFAQDPVVGRDVITGGVVVVIPQQCTDFRGPEEMNTTRGPFRPPVNESRQCAGRFGLNKAVYPSLGFQAGEGMLVIGGPYTRHDIFKPVPHDEPSPEPLENQPQPFPEETDSSQPLPPEPTSSQSQLPDVSPLQVQENNPSSLPPPRTFMEWQGLDPPGNYQEIMKWLHTGVSRGFHGPDVLGSPHG